MKREDYLRLLRKAPVRNLSLGYAAVTLFPEDEIDAGQVGYAVDPDGHPLTGGADGDWRRAWLVIGHEESTGDPIFIDFEKPMMPVCTAMHGMGDWQPEQIADSAAAFLRSLEVVGEVAHGRESPEAVKHNPVGDDERTRALRRVQELNPRSDLQFWRMLLDEEF